MENWVKLCRGFLFLGSLVTIATVCSQDGGLAARKKIYQGVAGFLEKYTDNELEQFLKQGEAVNGSYGECKKIIVNGAEVFVKQVPLTDIEALPENIRSTRNHFNLPTYYQYGIGSAGFGVWRELEAHIMTTQWVLNGQCPYFPLLYHWRILPLPKANPATEEQKAWLDDTVIYWNNNSAVKKRIEDMFFAPKAVTLFIESIPERVDHWLEKEIAKGEVAGDIAIAQVFNDLEKVTHFMQSQRFIHFDAHFKNILTDGKQLYLTDFGLAISADFALSVDEQEFFEQHIMYDSCYIKAYTILWLQKILFPNHDQKSLLEDYAQVEEFKIASPYVQQIFKKYAPFALVMNELENKLRNESKLTPYPAGALERLSHELL